MPQGFSISRAEESRLFEKATEKLDLYVLLCMEQGKIDKAREFLSDGRYVRLALKEFAENLFLEHPWAWGQSPEIDMERVYGTIAGAFSGKMEVYTDPGDFYHMRIIVSDEVSIFLNLYCLPGSIEVTIRGPDDDYEWRYAVAKHLSDEFTLTLLDQGLDDPYGLTEEHLGEFCDLVDCLHGALGRIEDLAEAKAASLIERHGLRRIVALS